MNLEAQIREMNQRMFRIEAAFKHFGKIEKDIGSSDLRPEKKFRALDAISDLRKAIRHPDNQAT